MLIRASDNTFVYNLDSISQIYIDNNGNLVCTVPSASSETGYDNAHLITSNYTAGQYYIRRLTYMYSHYVVNENGDMFIPPKVFTIDKKWSNIIYASNVSESIIFESAVVTPENKASASFILKANGRELVEGVDYTIILPYFRGTDSYHRFTFHILSSNTYRVSRPYQSWRWKPYSEYLKNIAPTINVNSGSSDE